MLRNAFACLAALALAMVTIVGSAGADEAQLRSAARERVEREATRVGVASTPAQAKTDQNALKKVVGEAIAVGEGQDLLERETNPSVLADLTAGARATKTRETRTRTAKPAATPNGEGGPAHEGTVEEPKAGAARRAKAHAAGCYGSPWTQYVWHTAWGSALGWVYVRENGWCGVPYRITWLGGPTFAEWSWGPYCLTGGGQDYSWDGYPAWVHMAKWRTLGVSYPWGCLGLHGLKTVLRIAWNGYWDGYNDYGF